jgi:UDP-N-acetyl-D-mannosaminuronate dehydrogenase
VTADLRRALEGCSLVIIATDHRTYQGLGYAELKELSRREPVTLDARGTLDRSKFPPGKLHVLGNGQTPS